MIFIFCSQKMLEVISFTFCQFCKEQSSSTIQFAPHSHEAEPRLRTVIALFCRSRQTNLAYLALLGRMQHFSRWFCPNAEVRKNCVLFQPYQHLISAPAFACTTANLNYYMTVFCVNFFFFLVLESIFRRWKSALKFEHNMMMTSCKRKNVIVVRIIIFCFKFLNYDNNIRFELFDSQRMF